MTKAIKKEETKPEVNPRQTQCEKELLEVLEKNNYKLSVELAYTPQAIIPRIVLVDTTENKDETESKPELKKG